MANLDTPVDDLEVGVRTSMLISELGVATLGELIALEVIQAPQGVVGELACLFEELGVEFRGRFESLPLVIPEERRVPRLDVDATPGSADTPSSRLGGHPSAWGPESGWPKCQGCSRPMRFVGQLVGPLEAGPAKLEAGRAVQLFACLHDDSRCESWEPLGGANVACLRSSLEEHPAAGAADAFPRFQISFSPGWDDNILLDENAPEEDEEAFEDAFMHAQHDKLGGLPASGNPPQVGTCSTCGKPLVLLAQLAGEHVPSLTDDDTCFVHICPAGHQATLQYVR